MTAVTDTFQRADGALGGNWTPWSWSGSGGAQIVSDAVTGDTAFSSGTGNFWAASSFGGAQFAMLAVDVVPTGSSWVGVTVRQSGSGNNGYLAIWFSGSFYLFRENGSGSPPQLGTVSGSLSPGDTLCIGASGSTITVYHNGAQVIQQTDSTTATGSPGIAFVGTGGSASFWAGGDGAVPPFAAFSATAGDGCQTWYALSPLNGPSPTVLRIVPPSSPAPGYAHSFLLALPVDTGTSDAFGDPVAVIQDDLGAPNACNVTLAVPSYSIQPWYADTPGSSAQSLESFTVALQAWLATSQFASGGEACNLIGFSKSGLGGSGLHFRHQDVFSKGAFWDSPFMMSSYSGTDAYDSSPVGGDPAGNYGNNTNFTNNYDLSAGTNITAWIDGTDFTSVERIWTGGFSAFPQNLAAYQSLLTGLGVLFDGTWDAEDTHAWDDGWVSAALQWMYPAPSSSGLLMAAGII